MSRLDLFLRDEVQQLIDAFAQCFRVKITLFSASMEVLRVDLNNPGSEFCRLVQTTLHRRHQCEAMDRQMCHRARLVNAVTPYRCHAGLLEATVPLRVEGLIVGFLMLGQYRDAPFPPPDLPELLREPFLRVPYFDATTGGNLLTLFSMLVRYLVNQELVSLSRGPLMDNIAGYIAENLASDLSSQTIAQAVNKSSSTVCHTVKAKTGLSLTDFLATKRVERFEVLVQQRPECTIQEASLAVGFRDALYFSRVYRRLPSRSAKPRGRRYVHPGGRILHAHNLKLPLY